MISVGEALPKVDVECLLFNVDGQRRQIRAHPTLPTCEGIPPTPTRRRADDADVTNVPAAVVPINKLLEKGTNVLVGMPGAFTPTCNDEHLPGYIRTADTFKDAGVSKVAVLTTNDRFVNSAWNRAVEQCMSAKSSLLMLSDGDADLIKQLGMVDDMGFGMGFRSKRFAVVMTDGVIDHVAVDPGMRDLGPTSAEAILKVVRGKNSPVPSFLREILDGIPSIPSLDALPFVSRLSESERAVAAGVALLAILAVSIAATGDGAEQMIYE